MVVVVVGVAVVVVVAVVVAVVVVVAVAVAVVVAVVVAVTVVVAVAVEVAVGDSFEGDMRRSRVAKEQLHSRILELRAQKLSWRAIGLEVGLTGARCHQIATGYDTNEPKPETIRSYLATRKRDADEHFLVIEAMLKAGLCE